MTIVRSDLGLSLIDKLVDAPENFQLALLRLSGLLAEAIFGMP